METKKEEKVDLDQFGKLRNEILLRRDKFRADLADTKSKIEAMTTDLERLRQYRFKLEGAIEASELFLNTALPSNNPPKAE